MYAHSEVRPAEQKYFQLEQVIEGVYLARALPGTGTLGNAAFVDLGDTTLIFDTFLTPQAAEALRKVAEHVTGRAAAYVINSHYHSDHVLGNQVFLPHATFIATTCTSKLIEARTDLEEIPAEIPALEEALSKAEDEEKRRNISNTLADLNAVVAALPTFQRVLPNVTFEEKLIFHGSKRRADLLTYGGGHTQSDAFLYLPDDKLALMGDLLFVQSHPMVLAGNPREWQRIIRQVKMLDLDLVVPGHGPVGTVEDLDLLLGYLTSIEEIAQSVIESRGTLEQARALSMPAPFDRWEGREVFSWNMEFLLEYLKSEQSEAISREG